MINEVAWAGTAASVNDEWIELRNNTTATIDLSRWVLQALDGTPRIALKGKLKAHGLFLLERTDDTTVSDIKADQIYSGALENNNEILQLLDPDNKVIDTININGGAWPSGSSVTYGSMERRGVISDSDTAWITNTGVVAWGMDAGIPNNCTVKPPCTTAPRKLKGTPRHPNWAYTVTATPSHTAVPTKTPIRTATFRPPGPQPLIVINEFVPRPGHNWNNKGDVNVEDEYIELLNHGTIDINLSGYTLDDEANVGSRPYRLLGITIKPGQRMVFYGSDTGLLLSDGGDGVRLLRPNGQLADAYNYTAVRFPDQSFCRLPDDGGADDWNTNCYPTPGLKNALSPNFVSPPEAIDQDRLCPIADTIPLDFILAECPPFGNNIWRRAYWDNPGWYGEKYLPQSPGKWPVFVD